VHEVPGRSILECGRSVLERTVCGFIADGLRVHRGRSVIEGAILVVRELFSDGPPQLCGQFAQATRTVRPVLVDGPSGAAQSC
jgi:hypothetical protein